MRAGQARLARPTSSSASSKRARALVEQRARPGEVAAKPGDPGLVRERVADRGVARDLDERLERVLEDER